MFYEQNHFVHGKQFCFFIMLMCICIVGFHWMKTDFICRQNGVILISRLTCYVRWEIGVEGQDWKLFDMHMVGCFHMLMQPAWLTFSPSSCNYAGGTRIAVCQPVPHPSLHPPPPCQAYPSYFHSSYFFLLPIFILFLLCQHQPAAKLQSLSASSVPLWYRLLPAAGVAHRALWQQTQTITATLCIHVTYMPVNHVTDFETDWKCCKPQLFEERK